MQPGQFLVNKDGEKRKILGVCGEIVFTKEDKKAYSMTGYQTKESLAFDGWSLLEEPWVPGEDQAYLRVTEYGLINLAYPIQDMARYKFDVERGNVHRYTADAELYKQKLIERMGRREN